MTIGIDDFCVMNDGPPVLCLHGFTGRPISVRPLTTHLARKGWNVHAPLLAGHGLKLRDLARSRWTDWLATADAALTGLVQTQGRPAGIVGSSMGGILGLRLALERPKDVASIVLLAAPFRLPKWQERSLRFLQRTMPERLLRSPFFSWPSFKGIDVSIPEIRKSEPAFHPIPIGAAASMLELADNLRPRIGEIRQPVLIVHSKGDRVVPFSASEELKKLLGSPDSADFLALKRSRHLLCLDVDRRQVVETIEAFLSRHHPR